MHEHPDEILAAREERAGRLAVLRQPGVSLLSVRANVPGTDKNLPEAYLAIGFFLSSLPLEGRRFLAFLSGKDGPTAVVEYRGWDPLLLKNRMVELESTHPLGAFVDADVFGETGPSLRRDSPRRCWICGAPVWECIREGRHSSEETLEVFQRAVRDHGSARWNDAIERAMRAELDLDPKFGLVTPSDCGSHPDMDHALMCRAGDAIRSHLVKMTLEGVKEPDPKSLFPRLKALGIAAEAAMRSATGGVNAYKGLIFSFGLVLGALGSLMGAGRPFAELSDRLRQLAAQISWDEDISSFGALAWKKWGFGGIRREAAAGFPALFRAIPRIGEGSAPELTMALVGLIADLEDTVLLKRAGSMQAYVEAKERIASITEYDPDRIREVTAWAKGRNLSFGGAADLLVCAVFLAGVGDHFHFGDFVTPTVFESPHP